MLYHTIIRIDIKITNKFNIIYLLMGEGEFLSQRIVGVDKCHNSKSE
jgi:hypothetical protein